MVFLNSCVRIGQLGIICGPQLEYRTRFLAAPPAGILEQKRDCSQSTFVFAVLYLTEFDGHFPCMNLAKIRDAVPLNTFLLNICWKTVHDRT